MPSLIERGDSTNKGELPPVELTIKAHLKYQPLDKILSGIANQRLSKVIVPGSVLGAGNSAPFGKGCPARLVVRSENDEEMLSCTVWLGDTLSVPTKDVERRHLTGTCSNVVLPSELLMLFHERDNCKPTHASFVTFSFEAPDEKLRRIADGLEHPLPSEQSQKPPNGSGGGGGGGNVDVV